MYREFLDGWLRSGPRAPGSSDRTTSPQSLWVYGTKACLRAFGRELEGAVKARRRKALFLTTADLKRLGLEWEGRSVGAEETKRKAAERRMLGRTGLVVLTVDPEDLTGAVLASVHQIVGTRYGARKATVVLSRMDPASAYHFRAKGQHRDTMPWFVGRILECGDGVEVTRDGAWCAEFVFRQGAGDDYRIKILRDRVGRVAVVRPQWDDDWAEGDLDAEGDAWKQGGD